MKSKLTIKVLLPLFVAFIYSCDFFAPYDADFLELSAEEINFSLFENQQQFVISYADSFDVNWEITTPIGWIEISPISGIINFDNPDTITVKINRAGLPPESYEDNIKINFQDKENKVTVKVKMEIKAIINISGDSLRLGFTDSLASFNISNEGNYPLKWNFNTDKDWISVEPDTGILSIDSSKFLSKVLTENSTNKINDTTITIRIDNKKLTVGDNTGILELKTEAGLDTIKVSAIKAAAALLSVSTAELDFGENIVSQKITINNLGEEPLNWSASSKDSWIRITPASGNFLVNSGKNNTPKNLESSSLSKIKSAEIEISVNRIGLPPGLHNSSVEITSNGGSATIDISMNVPEIPVLSASPLSLEFGATQNLQRIQISNSGTGKLVWTASASESWVNIVPQKDSITDGTKDLNVSILRLGLQPGNYSSNVVINSNGGDVTIPITMSVAQLPQLNFAPLSLSFTKENTESSFEIKNIGEGELTWQLSANQSWIQVSQQSGNTTTETDVITVSVNTEGLEAGTYSGNIQITSNFGNGLIQVSLIITETPMLGFSPSALNFGDAQLSGTFEIKNEGDGNLEWQLSTNETWIIISSANGNLEADQGSVIEVQIKKEGLTPGDYSGNIHIASNGGEGDVSVGMIVKENPVLSLSDKILDFGDSDSSKTFKIKNTGDGNLDWKLSTNESWISLSISDGILSNNLEAEIEVRVKRNNLTPGNYSGNISVTSNGGSEDVHVNMIVKENPKLALSDETLDFGDNDSLKTFEIKNEGDGNLNWELSANESWIIVSKISGSVAANQKEAVDVKINRKDLAPGNYNGSITVTSNGGDKTINISINIAEEPQLSVSVNALDFGSSTTSLSFKISNKGTGTLNWNINGGLESWISLSQTNGSVTTEEITVNVGVNRSLLSPGDHSSTIDIASNGGNESVEIKISILEEPILSVTKSSIDFGNLGFSDNFTIQNTGTGTLNWTSEIMYISGDEGWLQLTPGNGNTESSQIISVSAERAGLSLGVHTADIQIYSNGGNHTIHLFITVNAPPQIEVSTNLLDFGDIETEKSFGISNSGNGELTWELSTDESWIAINPSSGSTTSETDQVTVTVDRDLVTGTLAKKIKKNNGLYVGTVNIQSNDVDTTVQVKMTLPAPPELEVSTALLEFNSIADQKTFQISNVGGGTLSWSVETEGFSSYFINAEPSSGSVTTDPATVTVTIDFGGLGTVRNALNKTNNGIISIIGKITVYGSDDRTKTIDLKFVLSGE